MLPFIEKAILRKHRWPGMPTANQGTTTLLLSSTTQGHCKSFHPSLWKTWNLSSVPPFPTVVETRIAGADLPCCRPMFNSSQPLYIFIIFIRLWYRDQMYSQANMGSGSQTNGLPFNNHMYKWQGENERLSLWMPGLRPPPFWLISFKCGASFQCNFMTTEFLVQLHDHRVSDATYDQQVSGAIYDQQVSGAASKQQVSGAVSKFPVQLHDHRVSGATS